MNSLLVRRPIQRWFPLFILPTFICFIIGFIWPFAQGIYLSFCTFNTPRDAAWVGIQNYVKAFSDPGFANAFWNTAKFAVVSIILINVLAFSIAYALTQKMRGANLFRTVFFNDANAYMADGKYTVTWAFNHTPNVDSWRATVVSALAAYSASQTDANWDAVVTAFVDGWAYEYSMQNG